MKKLITDYIINIIVFLYSLIHRYKELLRLKKKISKLLNKKGGKMRRRKELVIDSVKVYNRDKYWFMHNIKINVDNKTIK